MLKTKDFYLQKVFDIRGKYIGLIDDIYIDFHKGVIKGFLISNYLLFSKRNFIRTQDIVSIEDVIIIKELTKKEGISFKSIKDKDVKDKNNVIKGILEDLLIEKEDLSIKGLVISSGIFDRIIKGKEILLLKECILGEDFVLYYGNNDVKFQSIPRKKKTC
ncbi:PRC-barrel domain-containing protein [Clostridium sp. AL.422]|uniref:PRC-barrel domain-containing protein n=1 Tax=Clostridium TaxID=1485 RepID=UPI00293DB281|nr:MULTISPECIES: PRC-barrel domain-containing protein [unclassified Clostridium]MDV4152337.1 PRC-barrel domain-containing protein [Clostridium sp. AL.422]